MDCGPVKVGSFFGKYHWEGTNLGGRLLFQTVQGPWSGNDFLRVSVTAVGFVGQSSDIAYMFTTHVNIDYDGASNAYGPPGIDPPPLDKLENARPNGIWIAVKKMNPNTLKDPKKPKSKDNPPLFESLGITLDLTQPDKNGDCPVIQGPTDKSPGYYKSVSSGGADSAKVPFGALSYRLLSYGVRMHDYGLVFRHDIVKYSGFTFEDGGHPAESDDKSGVLGPDGRLKDDKKTLEGAVGEVSYKVFLNLGGTPKTPGQEANNNFPTSFMVFPGSRLSRMGDISMAENADDVPMFLALNAEANDRNRGSSGLDALRVWQNNGRTGARPRVYENIVRSLRLAGYSGPPVGDFPTRKVRPTAARSA
jgi:hypothetical protein